jgi:hypothetical protein
VTTDDNTEFWLFGPTGMVWFAAILCIFLCLVL